MNMNTRTETDSMGPIEVPADRYYGAQTARSLIHFNIGRDIMPREITKSFGILKKAACTVNSDCRSFWMAGGSSAVNSGRRTKPIGGFRSNRLSPSDAELWRTAIA